MRFDWIESSVLAASPRPATMDDLAFLASQDIRAVITLTERPLSAYGDITPEAVLALDIVNLHLPVEDYAAPALHQVKEALAFIDHMKAEARPVLVHCAAGQGRTGTLLHAYYLSKGWGLSEARQQVIQRRPICDFTGLSIEQQMFLQKFASESRTTFL